MGRPEAAKPETSVKASLANIFPLEMQDISYHFVFREQVRG